MPVETPPIPDTSQEAITANKMFNKAMDLIEQGERIEDVIELAMKSKGNERITDAAKIHFNETHDLGFSNPDEESFRDLLRAAIEKNS